MGEKVGSCELEVTVRIIRRVRGEFILNGILCSLPREFQVLVKSVPEGAKFRNTLSVYSRERNFEGFASLFLGVNGGEISVKCLAAPTIS